MPNDLEQSENARRFGLFSEIASVQDLYSLDLLLDENLQHIDHKREPCVLNLEGAEIGSQIIIQDLKTAYFANGATVSEVRI
jgi:hypothetical protein